MPSLLAAVLPLLLWTPVTLAAGRELAPRPTGISAYAQQMPLVAASRGKFLTVWLESLDRAGWRYLGAFTDAEGNRITPTPFVVVPDGSARPAQLIGGDFFTLFLPHDDGVQMMQLDFEGRVIATHIVPVRNFRDEPSVARVASQFAAVEHVDGAARVVFFDREGTITRSVTLPCRPVHYEVLGVGTSALVAGVCEGGGGLRLERIASDGTITTTMLDPAQTDFGVRIAAAQSGNGTRVVWGSTDPEQSLKTADVSDDGRVWDAQTIAHGGGQPYEPLLVTTTPNGWLIPYMTHGRLHVARSEGASFTITDAPAEDFGHPASAAFLGTDILVADIQYESQTSRGRVRTRHIDANGQIGTRDVLSLGPARQLAPVIGAGSGSLVGVWTEKTATTTAVKAAHIAADGAPLASAVIDPNATLASDDLAWNGSHYLTVILRGSQLRAQRIDAFGARAGSPQLLMSFPTNITPRVSVVWAGDYWAVVASDSVLAYYAEVTADGQRSGWMQLPVAGILPDEAMHRGGLYDVALAYDGERVLVAWTEGQWVPCPFTCIGNRPAFVAPIDRVAQGIGAVQRLTDPYAFVESLSLAMSDRNLVAVANGYDERAFVTSLDDTLAPVATRTFDGIGDVAWDGSSFVLALREREQLTVRRLDASLRDAARVRVARIAPPDTEHSAASVAVALPGNAIIGLQEVDGTSGARAVGYAEQDLAYEAPRRRAVRR